MNKEETALNSCLEQNQAESVFKSRVTEHWLTNMLLEAMSPHTYFKDRKMQKHWAY